MKKLLIMLLLITFSFSNEKTSLVLQLNWLNQFQFAGYYIAKEKGFYEDVGLDVKINELEKKENLLDIIKNKKADFAIGRSSLIIDKSNGEDIVAIAAIYQYSPLMLLTTNIDEIKNIEDIKNKRVMITSDARTTASIMAMLNANNIHTNDITIQEHSFNIKDLINKKTDLMASYVSNEPIKLDDLEIEYKIFHPKDYGFDFYNDILFTSSKFIKENPTTTKNFYEATIKGWKYAFNHIVETSEIIYKKYNTQNKELIHLIKEGEILKTYSINEEDGDIGCINGAKIEKILNTFKVLGLTKNDIDLNSFLYKENHHKRFIFEFSNGEKNFIFAIISLVLILFILIIYFLRKINDKRNLLSAVLNSSDDLIYYKNKQLKYIGCNEAFEKAVELSKEQIIGKTAYELFDKDLAKTFEENDLKTLKTNSIQINNEWIKIKKTNQLFQSKKLPLKYNSNKNIGILGVARNITDLYEIQKMLEEQARTDDLTKALNKKSFDERIKEKINMFNRYESVFCIALLDIDDFKYINDNFGHDVGDTVLVKLSTLILDNIRETDLFFRFGGEEFIIIYPKTFLDEATISVEKIRNIIKTSSIVNNRKLTISIGLTQIKKGDTEKSIFKRIDELMYFSKKNGKDRSTIG